jgi:hypothetical protein
MKKKSTCRHFRIPLLTALLTVRGTSSFVSIKDSGLIGIYRCIEAIPDFVAPILRGLEEHTGLHSVLIMGGPIPKYGGEIRTIQ